MTISADSVRERRVIRGSRGKSLLLLLGAVIFVALGAFMYQDPEAADDRIWAIAGIGFFGLCGLVALAQLISPSTMTLDAVGVTVRTFGRARLYKWADIEEFLLWSPRARGITKMIGFNFKPDRKPKNLMVKVNEATAGIDAAFPAGWEISPEELLATLTEWKARYGGA